MFHLSPIKIVLSLALLALVPTLLGQTPPSVASRPAAAAQSQPAQSQPADPGLHPRVVLETSLGNITLELDAEKAPITVDNFIKYVESGYYAGTTFHRVLPTFVIQGGGVLPNGQEKKEGLRPPIKNEWRNGLKNVRGSISMARSSAHDSATSQFFINVKDNPPLDMPRDGAAYAVFGKVVEGMDVVDKIKEVETRVSPEAQKVYDDVVARAKAASQPVPPAPEKSQPVNPPVIKGAKLITPYSADKVKELIAAKGKPAESDVRTAIERQVQVADYVKKMEADTGKKVQKTASGIQYVVLKEGTGPSPKPTDTVKVNYTGWLLNGTQFDTGQGIEFRLSGVIKGWTEGVGLMKVGEKSKFVIPPELAYGKTGSPPKIPPNAPLVFEIELVGIK